MKEGTLTLDIRIQFFPECVERQWPRLAGAAVDAPALELFQAGWDGAARRGGCWPGSGARGPFGRGVPPEPQHSMSRDPARAVGGASALPLAAAAGPGESSPAALPCSVPGGADTHRHPPAPGRSW